MFKLPGVQQGSDLESLFIAVGFIVIQWGQAEQSLDLIVSSLSHAYEGKKAKRLPLMLKSKVDFLRKRLPTTPELSSAAADLEAMLSEFEALAPMRHDIVHGAIAGIVPTSRSFTFLKLDSDDEQHTTRLVHLCQADFPPLRRRLLSLTGEANRLARIVLDSRPVGLQVPG